MVEARCWIGFLDKSVCWSPRYELINGNTTNVETIATSAIALRGTLPPVTTVEISRTMKGRRTFSRSLPLGSAIAISNTNSATTRLLPRREGCLTCVLATAAQYDQRKKGEESTEPSHCLTKRGSLSDGRMTPWRFPLSGQSSLLGREMLQVLAAEVSNVGPGLVVSTSDSGFGRKATNRKIFQRHGALRELWLRPECVRRVGSENRTEA